MSLVCGLLADVPRPSAYGKFEIVRTRGDGGAGVTGTRRPQLDTTPNRLLLETTLSDNPRIADPKRAALIMAQVRAGGTPVPEPMAAERADGPTVADCAERFLEEYAAVRYKPVTMSQ